MALSTIDPTTALILVDLQKGIVGLPVAQPATEVIGNAVRLADAFRERELPVVLVRADGRAPGRTERSLGSGATELPPDWADLVPELNQRNTDHEVVKRTWGAFTNTGLHEYLRNHEATQVVVGGVATSAGVESTARQAHELGYHVTFATDAMTDLDAAAHEHSITRVFPAVGETGTTDDVLEMLASSAREANNE